VENHATMNHTLLSCLANLLPLHRRDINMSLTDRDRQKILHLPQSQDSALLPREQPHLPKEAHICSTKVICKSASNQKDMNRRNDHSRIEDSSIESGLLTHPWTCNFFYAYLHWMTEMSGKVRFRLRA
jgi:hypothetical protein